MTRLDFKIIILVERKKRKKKKPSEKISGKYVFMPKMSTFNQRWTSYPENATNKMCLVEG